MKRIKRYVVPVIFTVLGIWMIVNKTASLKIMGIIMVAISAVGITLHVTDREETKVPKIGYSILNGLIGAAGAFVLIVPDTASQYVRYLIGGIIILFAGATGYRMYRNRYKTPFVIADGVAVVMGIVVFFVTMDESFFPVAAGCSTAFTGLAALLGQIYGKPGPKGKKILKVNSTPIPVPNGEETPSDGAETNPAESPDGMNPAEDQTTEIPAETNETETKQTETRPAETNPMETRPKETSPAESRPETAAAAPEKAEGNAEKEA
ncbi:MAG: hypothetical protein J6U01_11165 [Clostridia bacterium]|nr:hypothetical protein [Clostridia bacterium]